MGLTINLYKKTKIESMNIGYSHYNNVLEDLKKAINIKRIYEHCYFYPLLNHSDCAGSYSINEIEKIIDDYEDLKHTLKKEMKKEYYETLIEIIILFKEYIDYHNNTDYNVEIEYS